MEAIQNSLILWPKVATGRVCTHTGWAGSGTVELISSQRLALTGGLWNAQPMPRINTGSTVVTTGLRFAVLQDMYLLLDNGADPIELVKITSVNGIYVDLAAVPTNAYAAGSTFQIVDWSGFWPIRAFTLKNTGGAAATIINGYNLSRSLAAGEVETVGSDFTVTEPLLVDATGTTVVFDQIAR